MEYTIVLDGVTKRYANGRGIEDVSLSVQKGEIFGFLGPNGAGKTTAMKIMTGLMHADMGRVFLGGFDVAEKPEKARSCMGALIEKVSAFPGLTAYENMLLGARYYQDAGKQRIEDCLALCGIERFKNERVKNFSLGMEQRLGIAMALISDPDILILDEPLNGLDVVGMVEMRQLFKTLADAGKTLFISSHLIHDVELTCTRVGIVNGGRLLCTRDMNSVLCDFATLENFYLSEVGENV